MAEVRRQEDSFEQKRETGTVLIVVGWLFWAFALMVALYFHPSAPQLASPSFRNIALALAAIGLVLNVWGRRIRRSAK